MQMKKYDFLKIISHFLWLLVKIMQNKILICHNIVLLIHDFGHKSLIIFILPIFYLYSLRWKQFSRIPTI